jgi:NADPH:quinone reductase-like Zn-dependent oxidoreductase
VLKTGGMLVSTLGQPPWGKAQQHQARSIAYMVQPNGSQLAEISRLIEQGQVRPCVEEAFPFAQAREAEERQLAGHVQGKLVLKLAV